MRTIPSLAPAFGRYHRVRLVGKDGVSLPYVLDRGQRLGTGGRLVPYGGENAGWITDRKTGLTLPAIRGGAGAIRPGQTPSLRILIPNPVGSATQGTVALNAAYVYGTSGPAIASVAVMRLPAGDTLTDAYTFVTGYTGTAANVNDLDFEFRNHSTAKPGSTVHASAQVDPGATAGWKKFSGMSFTLSAEVLYWSIIADVDGDVTDYATVLRTINGIESPENLRSQPYTTTDGFATNPTANARAACIVLHFSSGVSVGVPFTAVTGSTYGTNQRGFKLTLMRPLSLWGMNAGIDNDISGVRLWLASDGPGGTGYIAEGTRTISYNSFGDTGFMFSSPQEMDRDVQYRVVFTYSGAAATPSRLQIGAGADANLRAAMLGAGDWSWGEANGTTDWSNDNADEFPTSLMIVSEESAFSFGAVVLATSVPRRFGG